MRWKTSVSFLPTSHTSRTIVSLFRPRESFQYGTSQEEIVQMRHENFMFKLKQMVGKLVQKAAEIQELKYY